MDSYNTNTNTQKTLHLEGPYSKDEKADATFALLMREEYKDVLQGMEASQALTTKRNMEKEYDQLDSIENKVRYRNVNVPNVKNVDASFVKTPYHEVTPGIGNESTPFGLMIACDGYNFRRGLHDFWTMVVQQNVKVITSLNEDFAAYGWGVYRYFPNEKETEMLTMNGMPESFSITLKVEQTVVSKSMTTRQLYVNDMNGNQIHTVTHIHYQAWEDFEVPADEALDDLIDILQNQANMLTDEIEKLHKGNNPNPQKILIHCLAGRGRTGTALAILNAIMTLQGQIMDLDQDRPSTVITSKNVKEHLKLSIFSIVRRLREQRATAVQTDEQYYYIFKFVDAWLKKKIKEAKMLKLKKVKHN